MDNEAEDREHDRERKEHVAIGSEFLEQVKTSYHVPEVIGNVPGLFDAVVRSLPRCKVVEHEKVPNP